MIGGTPSAVPTGCPRPGRSGRERRAATQEAVPYCRRHKHLRRTRLGLLDARRLSEPGSQGAEAMAQAMAADLGWDEAKVASELEIWQRLVRVEGLVPGIPAPGPDTVEAT